MTAIVVIEGRKPEWKADWCRARLQLVRPRRVAARMPGAKAL